MLMTRCNKYRKCSNPNGTDYSKFCSPSFFYKKSKSTLLAAFTYALVMRGLFICKFACSHWKKWPEMAIFVSKWTFYLRIQDLMSKMTERIYRK